MNADNNAITKQLCEQFVAFLSSQNASLPQTQPQSQPVQQQAQQPQTTVVQQPTQPTLQQAQQPNQYQLRREKHEQGFLRHLTESLRAAGQQINSPQTYTYIQFGKCHRQNTPDGRGFYYYNLPTLGNIIAVTEEKMRQICEILEINDPIPERRPKAVNENKQPQQQNP